jgi:NitT/TauT family transport system substrate-binding protein
MKRGWMPGMRLWVLVTALLLAACAPAAQTPAVDAPRDQVKIGVTPALSYSIYQIAVDRGYFAQQGIDAELVRLTNPAEVVALLADGQLDVGLPGVSASVLNAIARGANIRLTLPMTTLRQGECAYMGYVVRRSDAEAGTYAAPADWAGARVVLAAGPQSPLGFYTEQAIAGSGLTLQDLEFPTVELAAQADALRSEQVDIVLATEPQLTRLLADPDLALQFPVEQFVDGMPAGVMAYGAKLLDNQDLGVRFSAAVLQAVREFRQPTDATWATVAAYTGLEADFVKNLCQPSIDPNGRVDTDQMLVLQAWLKQAGLVDQELALEQFHSAAYADGARALIGEATP